MFNIPSAKPLLQHKLNVLTAGLRAAGAASVAIRYEGSDDSRQLESTTGPRFGVASGTCRGDLDTACFPLMLTMTARAAFQRRAYRDSQISAQSISKRFSMFATTTSHCL